MESAQVSLSRRPGGRTAEVRQRVLESAIELLAEGGIANIRHAEVATRSGVHRSSIYRNWPDIESLAHEAILLSLEEKIPLNDTGDLETDLVDFLCALSDVLSTPVGRAYVQALHAVATDSVVRRTVARVLDARVVEMELRLQSARDREGLTEIDPYLFTEMLGGPVHLYALREYQSFSRKAATTIVRVVLAGFGRLSE